MSILKPNKPQLFEGKRDEFQVRAWIYKLEQYLSLIQVGNLVPLDEPTKINFAATFFTGNASTWWYNLVHCNNIPVTWDAFKQAVFTEFVPFDSSQRAREKLRNLLQRTSVSVYLTQFRNIILTVPDMTEGEKVDRFCQGLKPRVRLEVMKAGAQTLDDASRIALNVDAALFGSGMLNLQGHGSFNGPTPMEIGNMEQMSQREIDRKNNACFVCHKPGCRPYNHSNARNNRGSRGSRGRTRANMSNVNVQSEFDSAGPSSLN